MKYFKIERKFGSDISIDAEELGKAMAIFGTEKIGIFKGGAIEGKSMSGVVPDDERMSSQPPYDREIKELSDSFKGTFLEGAYKNLKKALRMPE